MAKSIVSRCECYVRQCTPARESVSPRTETEQALAAIWSAAEGGAYRYRRHFFEVGGHSLLAIQLWSRVRTFGVDLPLRNLFERPTVATLAEPSMR